MLHIKDNRLPSICFPAAAAAAALTTLANGDVDKVVVPNCGMPAADDTYADANGFGSDPME